MWEGQEGLEQCGRVEGGTGGTSGGWGNVGGTGGASICSDENAVTLIVVMIAQPYEQTKDHSTVYFRRVNCTVCELYFSEGVWY